jgi:adenylate cyclase
MSGDREQEYFADGITEDLITGLSRLSGLFVISRHSAFAYKCSARRIEEIGSELGVRYVLEGSVRRQGETLRITAQLVDARSGGHIWAQRYDRPMHDVFAVQDDVSTKIVGALAVALTPQEHARFGHEGTVSLEAYDQLLRGLERFWIYTSATNAEAQAFFRRALALDPEFAAAHAWLARSLLFDYSMQSSSGKGQPLESACHHARTAVNLDGLLPHALAVLGWAELWARNGEDSIRAGRRAVALDPNNADARMFLGIALWASGQGQEALQHIDLAMRLNPHPSALQFWARGAALLVVGRDEEALADLQESFRLRSGFLPSLTFAVWACTNLNRMDDARRYREEVAALTGSADIPLRPIWLNSEQDRRCTEALVRAGMTQRSTG